MNRSNSYLEIIERFCARDDLATYDPYDIWKTRLGYWVKNLFNNDRRIGIFPAALLTLFDTYVNNDSRYFYRRQEYPIARAWAALALLNAYESCRTDHHLAFARKHLNWLREHPSQGYRGPCWGIGFDQPIMKGLFYDANLPLSTMTPYPLEAFVRYTRLTGDDEFVPVIRRIFHFFDEDLVVMDESDDYLVTSYGAMRDRSVINAVSYTMFSLGLLLPFLEGEDAERARHRLGKLYRYLVITQRVDGSWLYSMEGRPFLDCYHSCIVVKNIMKTDRAVGLPGATDLVRRGYEYVKSSFFEPDMGLYKRFTIKNKPTLVNFDLYDNAEMLNLAVLMGDTDCATRLNDSIERHFVRGDDIFSQIDRFGLRYNRNTLRWAVLPYVYGLSLLQQTRLPVDAAAGPSRSAALAGLTSTGWI